MFLNSKVILIIIGVAVLACAVIFLLPENRVHEYPQDFELASVIPQNTMAYISFRNMTQFIEDAQSLGIVQLYNDPRMRSLQQMLNPSLSQIEMMLDMMQITPEILKDSFCGEFALALLNIDFSQNINMMPDLDVALFLNVGNSASKFKEKLDPLFKMSTEIKNAFCSFYKVVMPTPVPIFIALDNNGLFVTTKKKTMEYIFSNNAKVLSQYDDFIVAKQTVFSNNVGVLAYYNYQKIIKKVFDIIPEQYAEISNSICNIFKLNHLLAGAVSTTLNIDEVVDKIYVKWDMDVVPIVSSFDLLKFLPQDILVLSHGCINSQTIYDVIQQIIEALPKEMHSLVQENINNLEQQAGFTLKDLLLSLDNEIMLTISKNSDIDKMGLSNQNDKNQSAMMDVTQYIPEVALQVKCKDVEKMQQILTTLIKMIPNANLITESYEDNTLVSLEIPDMPLSPSFIFIDNRLVITLDSNTIKKIATSQNVPLPQELQDTLNKSTILQRSFVNIKDIIQLYYPLVLPMLENQVEAMNMKKSLLPSTNMLQKYLPNIYDTTNYQDNQLLEEIHSPTGLYSLNAIIRLAMMLKETFFNPLFNQQAPFNPQF